MLPFLALSQCRDSAAVAMYGGASMERRSFEHSERNLVSGLRRCPSLDARTHEEVGGGTSRNVSFQELSERLF